ncbi:tetratricopeptide repeat protein [Polyangium fumosum]|uniref:Tetratricopeptide repeat protein n=1 Tax=Polyangium fumosum TaxID=889272 RepID=A0A4U1J080_9BACT|nr:tetratricopeptide repeat protein [Polyangium fumosum]TKD00288.1 hypothetical protein E8A74_34865 [Polyangium fumosum]
MKPVKLASDEERWVALVAASGRGEVITPEDAAFLRQQEEADPQLAEEAALWAEIARLGAPRGEAGELDDGEIAARVLGEIEGERAPAPPSAQPFSAWRTRPRTRRRVAGLVAGFAFAAALGAFAATVANTRFRGPERPIEGLDAGPPSPALTGAPPKPVEGVAPPMPVEVVAPPKPVEVVAPRPPPKPSEAPAKSADELLGDAQAALAAGRAEEAISTYQALLARYPGSTEARAALVSLGRLSLSGGSAASALGYFDRYLSSGGGALGIEARYGRIQALQQLGRAGEAQAAIDDFLARHGDSVYATRLRERR